MENVNFEIQNQKISYECPRFKVEETIYQKEGQTRKTFTIRPVGDLLVIIPRLQNKILFIKTETPPFPVQQWGLPTGFVSPGIPIADIAQTILLENTGTVAQRFIYLGKMYPSRYINAIAHVMIGESLSRYKEASNIFEGETTLFTEKEVGSLLMNRSLSDGLVLASYVYYVTSEYYWTEVHDGSRNSNRPPKARS